VLRVEAPWHHINTPEDFRLAEQALAQVGESN
jgi:hypothetical protein